MNKQLSFVLLLALLGTTFTQALQETDIPELSCNNKFTRRFQLSEDTKPMVLSNPLKGDYDVCTDEFKEYGTCCDVEKLKAFAKSKSEKFIQRMTSFITKAASASKAMSERVWQIKSEVTKFGSWLSENRSKLKDGDQIISTLNKVLKGADEKFEFLQPAVLEQQRKLFLAGAKNCVNKIKTYRAGVLCKLCSGRVDTFLNGSKLRISSGTCTDLVKECSGTWSFIYQFMQASKTIKYILKAKRVGQTEAIKKTKEVGPDTGDIASELIKKLKAVAELGENLEYSADVGFICNKIFVADGENDDVAGDASVVEAAIAENKAEVTRVAALTPEAKKVFETAVQTAKTNFQNARTKVCETAKALLTGVTTYMEEFSKTLTTKLSEVTKKMESLKAEVAEKDKSTSEILKMAADVKIKATYAILKAVFSFLKPKIEMMRQKVMKLLETCPGGLDVTQKKNILDKLKLLSSEIHKAMKLDEVNGVIIKQAEDLIKKVLTETATSLKKSVEEFKKVLVEIQAEIKKTVGSRLLADATTTTASAKLTELRAKRDQLYAAIIKSFSALKSSFNKFYNENKDKLSHVQRKFLIAKYRALQSMEMWVRKITNAAKEQMKVRNRLLSATTNASGEVEVTTDKNANTADFATTEDKAPAATTNNVDPAGITKTTPTDNTAQIMSVVSLIMLFLFNIGNQ